MLHILLALGLLASPEMYGGNLMYPDQEDWASGGLATGDLNLDIGGYSIILDDGATGAGNGAMYFGQDTDLNIYRSAANTLTIEGALTLTKSLTLAASQSYIIGTRSKAAAPDNGQWVLTNAPGTAFAKLQLGPNEQAADTAVAGSTIKSTNAYSQAATNTTGGPLYLVGGLGTGKITVLFASGALSTLTFVVDDTSTTITEGTEWSLDTDDNTSAAALVTYLDANIAGFTATAVANVVWLDPATTTRSLSLSSADGGGTAFVVVDGAEGTPTFVQAPAFADYTRHHDVQIGAAIVGAAAPGEETIGTYRCKVFDANADLAYINVEVPTEWNGTSDMAIDLLVFTDQGDALGSGEIIEFDLVYRSVAVGEAYDNGTAVTILANVTGGASEVDKGQYNITATVDYDDTDQPLAVNDTLGFSIMRDVTTGDTYSGDVHVCRAQLVYTANALATH